MQGVLNDDDGDRLEQVIDPAGDEQHASKNKARDNDTKRAVKFC
jgi:hypothetical protein